MASFLDEVSGLALAAKTYPDQPRAFQKANNTPSGVSVGRSIVFVYFLIEPVSGTPGHVCKTFRANIRRTDCVGPILGHS